MAKFRRLYQSTNLFVLSVIIIAISSIINTFIPLYVKQILESPNLLTELLKLFSMILLQTVLISFGNYIMSKNSENAIYHLMKKHIAHLIDTPVSFLEGEKSGGITHKIIENFSEIRHFSSTVIPNFISSIIIVVGSVIILFLLDWKLSVFLIVSLVALILLLSLLSNYSSKFSDIVKVNNANLSGKLAEYIQQIRLIKFSNAQKEINDRLDVEINANYKASLKVSVIEAIIQPSVMLFFFAIIIGIFTYGAIRIQNNDLTLPVLISFLIYLIQLLTPFSQIGLFFNAYSKVKVSFHLLDEIQNQKSESELETENQLNVDALQPEILEIKNLSFAYDDSRNILNNISIKCNKGEKIAIVGPSGSGKSTIFKLLEKLYFDYDGQITLNDVDIHQYSTKNWRKLLSVVAQDTALLSLSIKDNLLLGVENKASVDVYGALEQAHLLDDVKKLPLEVDTEIGERGIKLSGGQQQRLQIARAIIRQSSILLMDEATSNLDSETEKLITVSMNELMKDKIAIIIAHRLSTIMDADRIYFVEDGKITGEGTHEQLMGDHVRYKKFVTEQIIR
ncbi:ABC transporter ATP-binding protein [Carnobacteriaceae bacterium zg-C25]|nr:ABC transporter ATP-binding protein [Carnobacteriaceae bacterium zg-C25]